MKLLRTRFGGVPEDLETKIAQIQALDQLEELFDSAITTPSLAEFQKENLLIS
jgi:hypothetical protein